MCILNFKDTHMQCEILLLLVTVAVSYDWASEVGIIRIAFTFNLYPIVTYDLFKVIILIFYISIRKLIENKYSNFQNQKSRFSPIND